MRLTRDIPHKPVAAVGIPPAPTAVPVAGLCVAPVGLNCMPTSMRRGTSLPEARRARPPSGPRVHRRWYVRSPNSDGADRPTNRKVVLRARPRGAVTTDCFEVVDEPNAPLPPGHARLAVQWAGGDTPLAQIPANYLYNGPTGGLSAEIRPYNPGVPLTDPLRNAVRHAVDEMKAPRHVSQVPLVAEQADHAVDVQCE